MTRLNRWTRPAWLLLVLGMLSLSLLWVGAQPQMGGRGKDISLPGYDSQNRISSQLFAKEAVPKGGSLTELTGVRAETYSYDKGVKITNLIVHATNSIYDNKLKVATSDKPVAAQTGDGNLKLSGVGFRYEQADSKLVLSNRVKAVISRKLFEKEEGK
ncbi:MAG: LPS export ABC transporter periplasmic protein LptC [Verrucomicrobiota bacterium]